MVFANSIIVLVVLTIKKVYLQECVYVVNTQDGWIRGRWFLTNNRTGFYGFLDIPYAKPPVGDLRFKEPVPINKWKTTLDTTENRKVCVQFDDNVSDPRETEDCLVLNVYVPEETFCKRSRKPLPVLIWIHGGSFRSWMGTMDAFGPHYFIDQNVLVVSINYRLGPLGFLSTFNNVIPGNLGLKDQLLAIKWVSKNIHAFGGDPKKVTLMGQSAGAVAVGYHLLNPQSKGLFRAAIMQSLSPLGCMALQKDPKDSAFRLASAIDPTFTNSNTTLQLLTVLQKATVEQLKNASAFKLPDDKLNCQQLSSLTWVPSTESENAHNPIITGFVHEKLKCRLSIKLPLLIGTTSQESAYYGTQPLPFLAQLYDNDPATLINGNLIIKDYHKSIAGKELKSIYTNSTFISNLEALVNFNSANYFKIPTLSFANFHSQHSDVYVYTFGFKGKLGQLNSSQGVGHGEDLNYLFQSSVNENLSLFSEEEVLVHKQMVALWAQFIKHRNPTKKKNELLNFGEWPKFTTKNPFYLSIGKQLSVKQDATELNQWLNVISKYAECRLNTY